jgi:hypothetical protein
LGRHRQPPPRRAAAGLADSLTHSEFSFEFNDLPHAAVAGRALAHLLQ